MVEDATLGPVRCHDCRAPGLFWTGKKWLQRNWKVTRDALCPVLVEHRCTGLSRLQIDIAGWR